MSDLIWSQQKKHGINSVKNVDPPFINIFSFYSFPKSKVKRLKPFSLSLHLSYPFCNNIYLVWRSKERIKKYKNLFFFCKRRKKSDFPLIFLRHFILLPYLSTKKTPEYLIWKDNMPFKHPIVTVTKSYFQSLSQPTSHTKNCTPISHFVSFPPYFSDKKISNNFHLYLSIIPHTPRRTVPYHYFYFPKKTTFFLLYLLIFFSLSQNGK